MSLSKYHAFLLILIASAQSVANGQCMDSTVVLLQTDLEMDNGGLLADSIGDWEYGVIPLVLNDSLCSGDHTDPPGANSGSYGWATNLTNCYLNSGVESVLTLTLDLSDPNFTSSELSFYQWHEVFVSYDHTEVRVNGNVEFFNDTLTLSPAWYQTTVDLTPYLGGFAEIEFVMFATVVVNRAGWYLDDLEATACYELPSSVNDVSPGNLYIYPNPVSDVLTVQLNGQHADFELEVFDIHGKHYEVERIDLHSGSSRLFVEPLASGVYILRSIGAEHLLLETFIKL